MHPRILAERLDAAHKQTVAAMQAIAAATGLDAPDITKIHERDAAVKRLKEAELVADFLTRLAQAQPGAPSLGEAIAAATVEELAELPGVGLATARRMKRGEKGIDDE